VRIADRIRARAAARMTLVSAYGSMGQAGAATAACRRGRCNRQRRLGTRTGSGPAGECKCLLPVPLWWPQRPPMRPWPLRGFPSPLPLASYPPYRRFLQVHRPQGHHRPRVPSSPCHVPRPVCRRSPQALLPRECDPLRARASMHLPCWSPQCRWKQRIQGTHPPGCFDQLGAAVWKKGAGDGMLARAGT